MVCQVQSLGNKQQNQTLEERVSVPRVSVPRVARKYTWNVRFPTKNFEACKETGKYGLYTGKNIAGHTTACENNQMPDLKETDFQIAIINMFTELKVTMVRQGKEGMMTMLH